MSHIQTNFDKFNLIKENLENNQGYTIDSLYELGAEHITDAANLLAEEGSDEWNNINNSDPSEVIKKLEEFGGEEAMSIVTQIQDVESQISEFPEGDYDDDMDD